MQVYNQAGFTIEFAMVRSSPLHFYCVVLPLRKIRMYLPSTIPYQQHRGFSRTFTPGHLSLGLFFPLEAFGGDIPSMLNQVALAK